MLRFPDDIEFANLDFFVEESVFYSNQGPRKVTVITDIKWIGEPWWMLKLGFDGTDSTSCIREVFSLIEVPGSYEPITQTKCYIRSDLGVIQNAYAKFMADVAMFRRFLRTEEARLVAMMGLLGVGHVTPGTWPQFSDLWNDS